MGELSQVERLAALREWRRTGTVHGNWPPEEAIEALADGGWTPDDLAGLVDPADQCRRPLAYYAMLTVPISPDPRPPVVLTWTEHLVAPALTAAHAGTHMPLRPAGFGHALTELVLADCAATIRTWYDTLGPALAPLAVRAGLTLDEARTVAQATGDAAIRLEILGALRRSGAVQTG